MTQPSVGVIWGDLPQAAREQVLEEVAAEAAERFKIYCDELEAALAGRPGTPEERLAGYRSIPPENWAELQSGYPDDHAKMLADWRKLEETAMTRREVSARVMPVTRPQVQGVSQAQVDGAVSYSTGTGDANGAGPAL